MRVQLFIPPGGYAAERWTKGSSMPPLGILYIAAALEKEGVEVRVVPAEVLKLGWKDIEREVRDFAADIIGVTSFTENRFQSFDLIRLAKRTRPEALTVMGGPHASMAAEDTLAHLGELDLVLLLVGEAQRRLGLGEPGLERPSPGNRGEHGVDEGAVGEGGDVLRQVPGARPAGPGERPGVGGDPAGQYLEQGRLPGAVRADEPHPIARTDGEGRVLEEDVRTEGEREAAGGDEAHRGEADSLLTFLHPGNKRGKRREAKLPVVAPALGARAPAHGSEGESDMKERMPMVLALAAGFLVLTGFGRCGHGPVDPARVDQMVTMHLDDALDDLKATDPQRAQVHALKDKLLQDGQKFAADQRQARQALVAQWDAAQPDGAQVHALVDARIDALRALAHEAADTAIQLHGILTPEQRAQISKKIHRRMDRR